MSQTTFSSSRFWLLLFLMTLTKRGWTQTYYAQSLSVGLQTVSSQDNGTSGEHLFSGPSGTYGYNFSPRVSLDTSLAWISGYQQGEYADTGHELLFTAGVKAGWCFQHWGLFGRVAPGLASFDHGVGIAYYPSTIFTYYRRTHFALQNGVVVQYYPTDHSVIRLDAGQTLISEFDQVLVRERPFIDVLPGHVASHFAVALTAGYRFGDRQAPVGAPSSVVSKFDLGALYALHLRTNLLMSDLEPNSGSGAWGDYNFSRWGAVDVAAFYLPHDDHTADYQDGGKTFEIYAGLKAGFRARHFGYFAKCRPGAIRFGRTLHEESYTQTTPLSVRFDKFYDLAFDSGGVIEFYPWRHLVLRTDMGDDLIWYRSRTVTIGGASTSISGHGANSFLFLTGAGWRF
jgi:hypothetical protein